MNFHESGLKLDKYGVVIGKRWGSGKIWNECVQFCHWKIEGMNWQCLSGVWGDELEGLWWNIEFKVSQSLRGLEDDSVTSIVTVSDSWNTAVQSFESHLNQIQISGKPNNQSEEPKSYSSSNQIKYRQGRHFLFSSQAALRLTTPLAWEFSRHIYLNVMNTGLKSTSIVFKFSDSF